MGKNAPLCNTSEGLQMIIERVADVSSWERCRERINAYLTSYIRVQIPGRTLLHCCGFEHTQVKGKSILLPSFSAGQNQ